jgi:hypothetical protein
MSSAGDEAESATRAHGHVRRSYDWDKQLLAMVHMSTEQLVQLVVPARRERQLLNRPASMPAFAFKSMPTPSVVKRATRDLDPNVGRRTAAAVPAWVAPPPTHRQPPRRKPASTYVPLSQKRRAAHSRDREAYQWRMPPTLFEASVINVPRPAPRSRSPPPAPLDRMFCRGVQRQLNRIQGERTPLRDRLLLMPGFIQLGPSRGAELFELLQRANPSRHNYANSAALAGRNLREVIADIQLSEQSAVRVEMARFDKELQLHELRQSLRKR